MDIERKQAVTPCSSSWPCAAFIIALVIVAAGAAWFRLPQLDLRPMHGDEANQAVKAGTLLEGGHYRYDPQEHHGPTLYYLFLPVAWLRSIDTLAETDEAAFRIVPVLFGIALIPLLLLVGAGLGRRAAVVAGILTAISPAMVFYSRYFIQEMLLVWFSFAAFAAGWRYLISRKLAWGIMAGVCVGLMHATKETCILAFASVAGAALVTAFWARVRDGRSAGLRRLYRTLDRRHMALFATVTVVTSVALFSSLFTYARGPLDSILTYGYYAVEAKGQGTAALHDKPWHYYLRLLTFFRYTPSVWWSEGLILGLAAVGFVAALAHPRHPDATAKQQTRAQFLRFLAFYTLLMTAGYSIIPYKTPWCLINFLQPMTLVAGVGALELLRLGRFKVVQAALIAAFAAGSCQLGQQALKANYRYYADPKNPYVYAHPVPAVRRLERRAEELAQVHPDGRGLIIKIMAPNGDYWPLPWCLRKFDRIGYWNEVPDNGVDADIIVVPTEWAETLEARLKHEYQVEFFGLRPGVLRQVYIDKKLWDAFMETRM